MVRPSDFCDQQEIRFVDFGGGSEFRILLYRPPEEGIPAFTYTAYDEPGQELVMGEFFTSDHLVLLDAADLVTDENFGTMVFDFSNSGGGWASAKYSAFGRFSLELNSACRDETAQSVQILGEQTVQKANDSRDIGSARELRTHLLQ